MAKSIKPVFRWRGDHLFCGELCLSSICENGKGGFEVAHAQFQQSLADGISKAERNRFFLPDTSLYACQQKIQDVYSGILGMLDISIVAGQVLFVYWHSNAQEFLSGKNDSAGLGCGGIRLGSIVKAGSDDNLYVFVPDSFSWRMAKGVNLSPLDTIPLPQVNKLDCLREAKGIVDPVLKSLEFSF